jgi:sigma-B regulation protein RsbU (phosphoserine phosphatase)
VLGELNRLTVGTMDTHRFATVFVAVFDPAASSLTYASAGHLPALVISPDGAARWLNATGAVIGWSTETSFAQDAVRLEPGDVFAVYSDGLTETLNPSGDDLGTEGFAELVRRHRTAAAGEIVAGVLTGVDAFAEGTRAADDRTLVVVKGARA